MDLQSFAIKLARSENLPALPQVVSTVLKLSESESTSTKTLEQILERDTGLTAKLLRVAHSSYYGGQSVPTVGRAVMVLGLNAVKSLVLTLSMQSMANSKQSIGGFDKLNYWKHSLATASASRILGKLIMPGRTEELFPVGMMHDIGIIVMERFAPEELEAAINLSISRGIPMHEAEQDVLGFNHSDVGALLAETWGLSTIQTNAIKFHHSPDLDTETPETTHLVAAADTLAHQCGFSTINNGVIPLMSPSTAKLVNLTEDQLEIIRSVLTQEVQRTQDSLHVAA